MRQEYAVQRRWEEVRTRREQSNACFKPYSNAYLHRGWGSATELEDDGEVVPVLLQLMVGQIHCDARVIHDLQLVEAGVHDDGFREPTGMEKNVIGNGKFARLEMEMGKRRDRLAHQILVTSSAADMRVTSRGVSRRRWQ